MPIKDLKLIKKLSWNEVFFIWQENEKDNPNWQKLTKERGFASWEDWRLQGYALPFGCDKASWSLYESSDATKVIPYFYGGPFKGWIEKHYGGKKEMTFKKLAKLPELANHPAIVRMKADFPQDSIVICLMVQEKIYVIEGMHRSVTLAIMAKEGNDKKVSLRLAIGRLPFKELTKVGQAD